MKVWIKDFRIDMLVKQSGIEFEVRTPDDKNHLGDCYVTMTGVTWCKGRTTKKNGVRISWEQISELLESAESKRTALKAVRDG